MSSGVRQYSEDTVNRLHDHFIARSVQSLIGSGTVNNGADKHSAYLENHPSTSAERHDADHQASCNAQSALQRTHMV